jgi:hypothetical protein
MNLPLYARPAANAAGGTRVEPTRRVAVQADQFKYTDSVHTDLAARFKALKAEQARRAAAAHTEAARAAKFAKAHAAQHSLLPDDSKTMPNVPRFLYAVAG